MGGNLMLKKEPVSIVAENETDSDSEELASTPIACIVGSSIFYLPIWMISLLITFMEDIRFDKVLWYAVHFAGISIVYFSPLGWSVLIAGIMGLIGVIFSPLNFKLKKKRFRAFLIFFVNLLFALPLIPIIWMLILTLKA